MVVIDESQKIKSGSSQRTKKQLGALVRWLPIEEFYLELQLQKTLEIFFLSLSFLDERILNHKYFVSFRIIF